MKTVVLVVLLLVMVSGVFANERVGEVETNGLMFKDSIRVLVFDDPDIKGVSCYVTYYDRSLSMNDSGRTSISCRKTGNIEGNKTNSNDIFSMRKGWVFKETKVARFWDAKRKVLVYLAYQSSVSDSKSYHSLSVVSTEF